MHYITEQIIGSISNKTYINVKGKENSNFSCHRNSSCKSYQYITDTNTQKIKSQKKNSLSKPNGSEMY